MGVEWDWWLGIEGRNETDWLHVDWRHILHHANRHGRSIAKHYLQYKSSTLF
jgi:hypothetical protein